MPHSSGGGFYGGGHYGGTHSGSGSHSNPSYPVSRKPYAGARRYVYYDRVGHYHNAYYRGSKNNLKTTATDVWVLAILMTIIMVPIVAISLLLSFDTPEVAPEHDYTMVITDETGLVDTGNLADEFNKFQDLTGVTPSLEVIFESSWEKKYSDLEDYAYDEYLKLFDDEYHWLYVISIPDDYSAQEKIKWQWEGMAGDDIGCAVGSSDEDRFTDLFQEALEEKNNDIAGFGNALASSLEKFSVGLMDESVSPFGFVFGGICLLLYIIVLVASISSYRDTKNMKSARCVAEDAQTLKCPWCGNEYVAGTIEACPACGGAIEKIFEKQ